ncbi:Mu transposase C-terminal domain-containing protein [Vibrio cholerae]|uniref:Mu transposase C-terminal domain-containing protein n=1 Tax=Vibrio cholerae TaxID=666 RepID=UPI0000F34D54|nr:Mu transposase C-terminal domain-containing protein [Vibrio cholerae]EAZ74435.1 transposon, transposition protein B, putative [Vibrio cholerae NCTC 8457]APF77648.1 transposon, transposition protein B, putative [Vibrio cholerae]APF81557.1 transposon, transposition protein B, putative [Vibrio cholerae]EKB5073018.1 DDE-type integrase/transposase/recombinase [Vibrio cholerae]KFE19275.1 integrase core domain protein [Vibrio cholerae]
MTTLPIKTGSLILWKGQRHKITRVLNSSYILGLSLDTEELEKIPVSEISPISEEKTQVRTVTELSAITDSEWETASRRLKIIEPLLALGANCTENDVKEIAEKSKTSQATLYRWLKKYRESGKLSSLINKKRNDKGKSKLSKEQDKLIDICIQKDFLKLERPSIKQGYDDYRYECKKSGLTPCSLASFSRRIIQVTPQAIALKRYGQKTFREKHSEATQRFPYGKFPLDCIQIDHTKPNVILVDDRDRKPIGRPWVTFAIDIYSRVITGFYLSLEAPSATSVSLCLTHSICRKESWLSSQHVETNWPCWGLMRTVHADNGSDFRSKSLERACEEYSISINWRPLGRPDFGGHIERLMRTVKTDLSNLQGTTFRNPQDRGEYDSEGRAIFTFDEFHKWLIVYITKYYHQRLHHDLNMSPMAKWEEGLFFGDEMPMHGLPDIIEDERKLYLDFLPYLKRTVQRYGISIDNVTYYHPSISRWIGVKAPYEDQKFFIKYELHQINHIYFLDPNTNDYLEVPRVHRHAPNMTRFELKKIHSYLKRKGTKNIDDQAIINAQRELKLIEDNASKETTSIRRFRQRKQQAPKAVKHVSALLSPPLNNNMKEEWDDVSAFDDIDLDI